MGSFDGRSVIPTVSPFVKATLEGLQRFLAKPTMKKAPVTAVMLEEMVRDVRKSQTLSDLIKACHSMPISICRLPTF